MNDPTRRTDERETEIRREEGTREPAAKRDLTVREQVAKRRHERHALCGVSLLVWRR